MKTVGTKAYHTEAHVKRAHDGWRWGDCTTYLRKWLNSPQGVCKIFIDRTGTFLLKYLILAYDLEWKGE